MPTMTPFQMAMAALRDRPDNYSSLPPDRQWEVDNALGINDWNGIDIDAARACVEADGRMVAAVKFGMNIDELRQVVRLFDLRYPAEEE